jgi:hypothetical protein
MRSVPRLLLAASAAALVGTAAAARAEPDAPPGESADVLRPRLGAALGGAFGLAPRGPASNPDTAVALNPTLQLDLGLQISPRAGVYFHGEIGTIFLASQAAVYVVGEWSPVGWLSFGTGVGWDGMADWCGDCSSAAPRWSAVSIPLLVGIDVWRRDHHALRVGFEWAGGDEPSTGTLGWHTALTFGWALK